MPHATWITNTQFLLSGPVLLKSVSLTATAGGNATATIYDGTSDDGEVVCIIKTLQSTTLPVSLNGDVIIHTGVYVELGSNVEGLLVVWDIPKGDESEE